MGEHSHVAPAQTPEVEEKRRAPETRRAGGVLDLQRTVGNRAVGSMLLSRKLGGAHNAGQMIKQTETGALYEIISSTFDKDLGEWSYKVHGDKGDFVVGSSNAKYDFSSACEEVEKAGADPAADFTAALERIPEKQFNDMAGFTAWLKKMSASLPDDRWGVLAANILLVYRHAPKARKEAVRLLSVMLQDKDTALRMITLPTQVVIVPRDKQMTELDEFRSLLENDSGAGKGKTFDGRQWAHVRGVGDLKVGKTRYAAITEENLLGGAPDPKVYAAPKDDKGVVVGTAGTVGGGYTVGYSTTTHEFAHLVHRTGLSAADKKVITDCYTAKRTATGTKAGLVTDVWPDGPRVSPTVPASWVAAGWTDATWIDHVAALGDGARRVYECYASQSEEEYFAQLANAYMGTNLGVDPTTRQPRHNGRAWVVANEGQKMIDLLDKLFKNKTVNDIDAGGALKAGGQCTNPAPAPVPPPPIPPPKLEPVPDTPAMKPGTAIA